MSKSPSHAGTSIYYNGQDKIELKVNERSRSQHCSKLKVMSLKKIALRIHLQYKKKFEKVCFLLQLQKRTPK